MYEARQNKEKVSRRIDVGGGARQRVRMNNSLEITQRFKSTDFANSEKDGSPVTYKIGDKYVKRWKSDSSEKSSRMEQLWRNAERVGVRVPRYKRECLEDNPNEFVFWAKQCKGTTFFQHSKGHKSNLETWLSTKKHGTGYLKRLRNMFRVADMGDPQGFYEDWQNGAFEFIDIQPMTNNHLMSVYADYIDGILA